MLALHNPSEWLNKLGRLWMPQPPYFQDKALHFAINTTLITTPTCIIGDTCPVHMGKRGASTPAWRRPGAPPRLAGGPAHLLCLCFLKFIFP